ncbi:MAG: FlgD immunoglobulin-like domain containing protein, partial [bacterium]|nr:FlgD immunoglobulin-like domain containing protein [bacterium]
MESTGPIDIAPGQTAKVIVCLICANFDYAYRNINDTLAIDSLRLKARYAKTFYDQLGVSGSPNENTITPFVLQQNAPNPFKQVTTIDYQLAQPGQVNLKVYNIAGQLVKTLVSGQVGAGQHSIKWDGRDNTGNKVSSGIYIYRLQAENKDVTRKLVLLR